MGKDLTTAQKTEIAKSELKERTLVTIDLDTPIRILENDTLQLLNVAGHDYVGAMLKRSEIETSMEGSLEKCNITISNVLQEISGIIANEGDVLTNSDCKIEQIIFNQNRTVDLVSYLNRKSDDIKGMYAFKGLTSGTTVEDLSGNGHTMTFSQNISTLLDENGVIDTGYGNGDYWGELQVITSGKTFISICKLASGKWIAIELTTGYLYYSNDNRETWNQGVLIESGTKLIQVIQLQNGTICVTSSSGKLYKSTDDGVTFDSGLTVSTAIYGITQLSSGEVLVTNHATTIYSSTDNANSFTTSATITGATLKDIKELPNGMVIATSLINDSIYKRNIDKTWSLLINLATTYNMYDPFAIGINAQNEVLISCANANGGTRFNILRFNADLSVLIANKITSMSSMFYFALDEDKVFACHSTGYHQSLATWTIADNDDMSFGDGTTDSPFSLLWYGALNNTLGQDLISKRGYVTGNLQNEYGFKLNTLKLEVDINDLTGTTIVQGRLSNVLTDIIGENHLYSSTYSGNKSRTGLNLYDGSTIIDTSDTFNGTYTGMSNGTADIGNYYLDANGIRRNISSSKLHFIAIIKEELTAGQIGDINTALNNWLIGEPTIIDEPIELFSGKINNINLNSLTFSFDVERKIGGYSTVSPNMTYDCSCQYKFKDIRCGYSGSETKCDKTLSRCQALSNVTHFGGFPTITNNMVIKG